MERGQEGEKGKERTLRGGQKLLIRSLYEVENAKKTPYEMVGRLAHKFTSILKDLNVKFKKNCHLFHPDF